MNRVITILTNEQDFAADSVIAHLNNMTVPIRRINIEAAESGPVEPWLLQAQPDYPVVWWRQFQRDIMPADLEELDEVLVNRAQWRAWVTTLRSPGSTWINDLWAARRAEDKVDQLRVARELGFHVPETIITNNRDDAMAMMERSGDCVVKTLTSAYFSFSDQSFVFTEPLDHPALSRADRWPESPLMVQKRLHRAMDARVISFGRETFGARCQSPTLDWRKTPFDPELWTEWAVPQSLVDLCRRYRESFSLEYAAFDFMIDDEVWFLEANQAGEFSFLDRSLDLGIAQAFAHRLAQLSRGD